MAVRRILGVRGCAWMYSGAGQCRVGVPELCTLPRALSVLTVRPGCVGKGASAIAPTTATLTTLTASSGERRKAPGPCGPGALP